MLVSANTGHIDYLRCSTFSSTGISASVDDIRETCCLTLQISLALYLFNTGTMLQSLTKTQSPSQLFFFKEYSYLCLMFGTPIPRRHRLCLYFQLKLLPHLLHRSLRLKLHSYRDATFFSRYSLGLGCFSSLVCSSTARLRALGTPSEVAQLCIYEC